MNRQVFLSTLSSVVQNEYSIVTSPSMILTMCLCSPSVTDNEQVEVTYAWFSDSVALMGCLHIKYAG